LEKLGRTCRRIGAKYPLRTVFEALRWNLIHINCILQPIAYC